MNLKILTIKKSVEFKKIKNNSHKFHCHTLILLEAKTPEIYLKNYSNNNFCRIGITVSKIVSKSACKRNLIKRRIKSALSEIAPAMAISQKDYVIIAKKQILEVDYKKIYNDLKFCFRKIKQSPHNEISSN